MSKKQKMWFGVIALLTLNIAFFIEDFASHFEYWNLVYTVIILILLVALIKGCFRWTLQDKENKKPEDKEK